MDTKRRDQWESARQAIQEVYDYVRSVNGTTSAEHGIGLSKAPFMTLEHDPVAMDVMRSIKRLFDPNNILNPGKMALDD